MSETTLSSAIEAWESAYRRFETPAEERSKFIQRLGDLGVDKWDRSLRICELFCGRGNGLRAWLEMGFKNIEGLDRSAELVCDYDGPAKICVGDARELPYKNSSFDAIAVQGGLHHLSLMVDLNRVLAEIQRVLKPNGRLLIVEPWLTTYLKIVHAACGSRLSRRLWGRLDALATMIDLERETYENWLAQPDEIRLALERVVEPEKIKIGWGKLMLVGRRRS